MQDKGVGNACDAVCVSVLVPYRDSKLTRILQPALGGNANTAIICNITLAPVKRRDTRCIGHLSWDSTSEERFGSIDFDPDTVRTSKKRQCPLGEDIRGSKPLKSDACIVCEVS
ncbi:hypothetical protein DY000_02023970 [Brassica cretica]|uniref:Kinesin motor domain-containing protein n=1 Tax=Brassica cretica TaxID=69181 RepID=A0ABQ7E9I4_BRACR|nr:hypothetical protein DY000_02023970 [Brassica cretica]